MVIVTVHGLGLLIGGALIIGYDKRNAVSPFLAIAMANLLTGSGLSVAKIPRILNDAAIRVLRARGVKVAVQAEAVRVEGRHRRLVAGLICGVTDDQSGPLLAVEASLLSKSAPSLAPR